MWLFLYRLNIIDIQNWIYDSLDYSWINKEAGGVAVLHNLGRSTVKSNLLNKQHKNRGGAQRSTVVQSLVLY